MSAKIQSFQAASRFAVVGASTNRAKFGNKVLRCYMQHQKAVTPINPKEKSIEGLACVSSLADLNKPSEVSVSVITPPKVTVGVLEEAAKLGISNVWLQPGCDDAAVLAKAKELGLGDSLIYGGPCVLVELGYDDTYTPPSPSSL